MNNIQKDKWLYSVFQSKKSDISFPSQLSSFATFWSLNPMSPSSLPLESPILAFLLFRRYWGFEGLNLFDFFIGDGWFCCLASSRILALRPGLSGDYLLFFSSELSSSNLTGELWSIFNKSRFSSCWSNKPLNWATFSSVTFLLPIRGLSALPLSDAIVLPSCFYMGLFSFLVSILGFVSGYFLPAKYCLRR